jgi:hypothetical protein
MLHFHIELFVGYDTLVLVCRWVLVPVVWSSLLALSLELKVINCPQQSED